MLKIDQKQLMTSAIFVMLFLILLDLIILNLNIKRSNDLFYKEYIQELENQNKLSEKRIDSLKQLMEESNLRLQKISDQKDKIKAIYIENDKKIDTLSANGIINEYQLFFSNFGKK